MQEGEQVVGGIMKDVPQSSPANNDTVLATSFPLTHLIVWARVFPKVLRMFQNKLEIGEGVFYWLFGI